jgi:hypothetical protein
LKGNEGMPEAGGQQEKFIYFVDDVKFETEHSTLTGAQIKAAIPGFDPTYSLFLEEPGDLPDQLITDNESVSLSTKGPGGHRRFNTVPPASFGQ